MPFKHACFISYRHNEQSELANTFVDDLYKALVNELTNFTRKGIFMDRQRLHGGHLFNEELSRAICESVCMIVVFTPTYFNRDATYCTREYCAMERLEKERLTLVEAHERSHGLIIPIILRGSKYLPSDLIANRHYYNFEKFTLADQSLTKNALYTSVMQDLAEYIADRCMIYENIPASPHDCSQHSLPNDAEIAPYLSRFQPAFPGR